MGRVWSCAGLRWGADGPALVWGGGRVSPLARGGRIAFGVAEDGVRTCVGARGRSGRPTGREGLLFPPGRT
ncbi:hypothetical protein ABZS63_33690, partial [Streptomyces sp. NPDC005568]